MEKKKIIFSIAICLLFIPMVYLGVNTFYPIDYGEESCYRKAMLDCKFNESGCMEQNDKYTIEEQACVQKMQSERRTQESYRYITLVIICIISALITLLNFEKSINYGIFFGVVITAFTATIRYIDSRSKTGFFLMVLLFIIVVLFIQRQRDDEKKTK